MKNKDINLLIAKKQNAEAYKGEIENLKKEIKEIQQKIDLTILSEEKADLKEEKKQKEEEIENMKSAYNNKRATIEEEILALKGELMQKVENFESKLISKEEIDKLEENKVAKEAELAECEKDIKEVKEKLKELIDKDGGYEQDTATLSKKLDDLTAYRKYIRDEEIPEIDNKLKDAIIIEENIDLIKEIKYMEIRLSNLSYDYIEEWNESEQKIYKEYLEKKDTEQVKEKDLDQEPKAVEQEKVENVEAEFNVNDFLNSMNAPWMKKEDNQNETTSSTKLEQVNPIQQTDKEKTSSTKQEQVNEMQQADKEKTSSMNPKSIDSVHQQTDKTKTLSNNSKPERPVTTNSELAVYKGIIINAEEGKIYYSDGKKQDETVSIGYSRRYWKDENLLNIIEGIFNRYDINGKSKSIAKACDPNIINVLEKNPEMLEQYVLAIYNDEAFSFGITYNLEGMYNADFLTNREKAYLNRTARKAEMQGAEVKRDSLLDRAKGWIKSHISKSTRNKAVEERKREMLNEGAPNLSKQQEKFQDVYSMSPEWKAISSFEGTKDEFFDYIEELKNSGLNLDKYKDLIKEKKRELVTNKEVIIEHPDGTKQKATRLWSRDEEVK